VKNKNTQNIRFITNKKHKNVFNYCGRRRQIDYQNVTHQAGPLTYMRREIHGIVDARTSYETARKQTRVLCLMGFTPGHGSQPLLQRSRMTCTITTLIRVRCILPAGLLSCTGCELRIQTEVRKCNSRRSKIIRKK